MSEKTYPHDVLEDPAHGGDPVPPQPDDLGETSCDRSAHLEPATPGDPNEAPENQVGAHRTVLVDFDATLYSYVTGWHGDDVLPDPPENGSRDFVEFLLEEQYNPVVFSSRARTQAGKEAIEAWLVAHRFPLGLQVTATKLPAVAIVDDRGIRYRGRFSEIKSFFRNYRHRIPSGSRG
jgi:hypothetical protein